MPSPIRILKRVVFGVVMIAAVVGVLALEHLDVPRNLGDIRGIILGALAAVAAVVGFIELGRLTREAGAPLLGVSGLAATLLLGLLPIWQQLAGFLYIDDAWALLGLIVLGAFAEQMIRFRLNNALARLGATLLAVMYLASGIAVMLSIRLTHGALTLGLFLVAVKLTDVGAYFTGTACGKHKMIPWLSPGKSWEGLAGGVAVGTGASVLAAWLLSLNPSTDVGFSLAQAAVWGVVLGLAGQVADLCESLLKRSAAIKDSGALVPEFGGVLDILDSPLLAAPVAYVLLLLMR